LAFFVFNQIGKCYKYGNVAKENLVTHFEIVKRVHKIMKNEK
jgi:hypothetical protein